MTVDNCQDFLEQEHLLTEILLLVQIPVIRQLMSLTDWLTFSFTPVGKFASAMNLQCALMLILWGGIARALPDGHLEDWPVWLIICPAIAWAVSVIKFRFDSAAEANKAVLVEVAEDSRRLMNVVEKLKFVGLLDMETSGKWRLQHLRILQQEEEMQLLNTMARIGNFDYLTPQQKWRRLFWEVAPFVLAFAAIVSATFIVPHVCSLISHKLWHS